MAATTVTRTIDAAPKDVWKAFTDDELLARWFWPESFVTAVVSDTRVGGSWRISSERKGLGVSGVFSEVDEPTRLAYTWVWDGSDTSTDVVVTMSAHGGGTDILIEHDGFETDEQADDHRDGWNDCLDRLPTVLA